MVTQRKSTVAGKKRREILPKALRKRQLIQATMECIADVGLSQVTLSAVTKKAALSQGIANLHFDSKENLLMETLRFVTDEYNSGLQRIFDASGGESAEIQLRGLVEFQFSRSVTEVTKMAVWFAFYGEAKSRPTYQSICVDMDRKSAQGMKKLITRVALAYGQEVDAALIADGYIALIDGLWLNLLLSPRKLNRVRAKRVALCYLSGFFPSLVEGSN